MSRTADSSTSIYELSCCCNGNGREVKVERVLVGLGGIRNAADMRQLERRVKQYFVFMIYLSSVILLLYYLAVAGE